MTLDVVGGEGVHIIGVPGVDQDETRNPRDAELEKNCNDYCNIRTSCEDTKLPDNLVPVDHKL